MVLLVHELLSWVPLILRDLVLHEKGLLVGVELLLICAQDVQGFVQNMLLLVSREDLPRVRRDGGWDLVEAAVLLLSSASSSLLASATADLWNGVLKREVHLLIIKE